MADRSILTVGDLRRLIAREPDSAKITLVIYDESGDFSRPATRFSSYEPHGFVALVADRDPESLRLDQ